MPRPYAPATPTAATSTLLDQGLTHTSDGSTVAMGAEALIQLAAGTGHVMGGASGE